MRTEAEAEEQAHRRLCVLELADTLGNVSAACRQYHISRTEFYRWKRRYQEWGLAGLKDRPPIPKTHPQTISPAVVAQILALSRPIPVGAAAP